MSSFFLIELQMSSFKVFIWKSHLPTMHCDCHRLCRSIPKQYTYKIIYKGNIIYKDKETAVALVSLCLPVFLSVLWDGSAPGHRCTRGNKWGLRPKEGGKQSAREWLPARFRTVTYPGSPILFGKMTSFQGITTFIPRGVVSQATSAVMPLYSESFVIGCYQFLDG